MDQNDIKGEVRHLAGHAKDAAGGLTGDVGMQADGKVDQVAGRAQQAFGRAADAASDLAGKASDAASNFGEQAQGMAEAAAGQLQRVGHAVAETVEENRWLALVGAGLAGYLLAYLMHGSSSPFAPRPKRVLSRFY